MTAEQSDLRTCPFCAEEIKAAAVFCKHCRQQIDSPNANVQDIEALTGNCWNCNAEDQPTSGTCSSCGFELDAEKYVNSQEQGTAKSTGSNWIFVAVGAVAALAILGAMFLVNSSKSSQQAKTYPTAETVREGAAAAIAFYCKYAPDDIGVASNWMSVGGETVFINTMSGQITLRAERPANPGEPGEFIANDALTREALEVWACESPMIVMAE